MDGRTKRVECLRNTARSRSCYLAGVSSRDHDVTRFADMNETSGCSQEGGSGSHKSQIPHSIHACPEYIVSYRFFSWRGGGGVRPPLGSDIVFHGTYLPLKDATISYFGTVVGVPHMGEIIAPSQTSRGRWEKS